MDIEPYVEAGLYDPDASDGAERLELLEALERFGASPHELALIDREIGLAFVPIISALQPRGASLEATAASLDISPDELAGYLRTAGLPELEPGTDPFTDEDVEMFRAWQAIREFIGLDMGQQLLRTAGASCARLAEGGIATFAQVTAIDSVYTGHTDLERVQYNEAAMAAYFRAADSLTRLLRHHMWAALQRWQIAGEQAPRRTVRFFVGFVDLVGYTPLSHHMSIDELAVLCDHFETVALSATATHNGRIVKHIGDEVMFVANTADAALDIALTMVEEFRHESGQTTPRGGVAVGDLLGREGDFYGPAVNLASRAADLAVPEEILVSEEVFEDATAAGADQFAFVPAGRRQLKGFPDPVQLYAAHRA